MNARRLFALGSILMLCAMASPFVARVMLHRQPPSYRMGSWLTVTGYQARMLDRFLAESGFSKDETISFYYVPGDGSMGVRAVGASTNEAIERVNAITEKLKSALAREPGVTVGLSKRPELPQRYWLAASRYGRRAGLVAIAFGASAVMVWACALIRSLRSTTAIQSNDGH